MSVKDYKYDYVVIGSGIAGLNFALTTAQQGRVAVITKKELMESNSNYAQGGIAAVLDKHDSFTQHIEDTLRAGCYLNDRQAVEVMVREAPQAIEQLISYGTGFNRHNKSLALTREGGHSHSRIVHAKDATGREIEKALIYNIRQHKNIDTFESYLAVDLLMSDGTCQGVSVLADDHELKNFVAPVVVLATGGLGQVYKRNCNPKIATGDGFAMAKRAGAMLKHMEFVQFHPTALALPHKPAFLISETVRGEGGRLVNSQGQEFMGNYHSDKEMAPRDIVSRAVFAELKNGPVFLDIRSRGSNFIKSRFPYLYEQLWWYGIKMDKDKIPVAPAAHYACGGVHTDLHGCTSLPGLYAIGEVAHTGVHGGNRLASNSLLECVVFSSQAAKHALQKPIKDQQEFTGDTDDKAVINGVEQAKINNLQGVIQDLMWENVSIVRQPEKMNKALLDLQAIAKEVHSLYSKNINRELVELRNLLDTALLITQAASDRKVSACAHFIKKT